jgi:hypothetical protein
MPSVFFFVVLCRQFGSFLFKHPFMDISFFSRLLLERLQTVQVAARGYQTSSYCCTLVGSLYRQYRVQYCREKRARPDTWIHTGTWYRRNPTC